MDLIIQGIEIETSDLRELAKLSGASQIERINRNAFRLIDASRQDCISELCLEAELDFAFVDEHKNLNHFRLMAMDMDSTLVGIETIDEIADIHGIRKQVAEITEKTMYGEVDFSEGLIQRVALFKGLDHSVFQRVYDERLMFNPGAEKMLKQMKIAGIKTMLISGGFTFFTDRLKDRLGLDYTFANTLEIVNGKLTGRLVGEVFGAKGKGQVLNKICNELGFKKENLIAIGDGANDLPMFAEAGVSIAYHAKPIVQENATYSINHVGLDGVINILQ
jgi:phosphoserine phosphatase